MNKNVNYIHGSAAEQLQNDISQESLLLKSRKKKKSNNKVKLKAVCAVALVFAFGMTAMYRYAALTELNYSINSTYREYNELKKENSRLRMEVDSSMDLRKLQDLAETRLQMKKPDEFQTIHLAVPKSDITIVAEQYSDKNEEISRFGAIINKLGALTGIIF